MLTVGLEEPTWNLEMMSISRTILMKNLVELMMSGISGRSRARVEADTAVSSAEDSAEKADNLTYVREVSLTSIGTNASAKDLAAATNTIDIIVPSAVWKMIKV